MKPICSARLFPLEKWSRFAGLLAHDDVPMKCFVNHERSSCLILSSFNLNYYHELNSYYFTLLLYYWHWLHRPHLRWSDRAAACRSFNARTADACNRATRLCRVTRIIYLFILLWNYLYQVTRCWFDDINTNKLNDIEQMAAFRHEWPVTSENLSFSS